MNVKVDSLNELLEYLPFLIPIVLIEWGLAIAALVHILKHPHYRCGNRVLWILLSLCVQLIGPILYFVIGRGEDDGEDDT